MRKIRDVLRLSQLGGLSRRAIARSLKISPTTAGECLRRVAAAGLVWEQVQALDDAALERRLYPGEARRAVARPQPDWAVVYRELRRKGVTLALLWDEPPRLFRRLCRLTKTFPTDRNPRSKPPWAKA